jgi:hypothetical protein
MRKQKTSQPPFFLANFHTAVSEGSLILSSEVPNLPPHFLNVSARFFSPATGCTTGRKVHRIFGVGREVEAREYSCI